MTIERKNRRRLASWQQLANLQERRAWRVQHDVLALANLLHTVDAHEQALDPLVLLGLQSHRRANQYRMTFQNRFYFAQVIRLQRRAGRNEIADRIRAAEARRDFYGAGQRDDVGR